MGTKCCVSSSGPLTLFANQYLIKCCPQKHRRDEHIPEENSVGPHFMGTLSHWHRDSDAVLEGTDQASISIFLRFIQAAGWWQQDKRHLS